MANQTKPLCLVVFWLFIVVQASVVISAFSPRGAIRNTQRPCTTFARLRKNGDASHNPHLSTSVAAPREKCRTATPASASAISSISRSVPGALSTVPRTAALLGFFASFLFAVVLARGRQIFYPGSAPDPAFSDIPVPPGDIGGCPFVGNVRSVFALNKFLYRTSRRLGSPKIWRYFGFGKTIAVMSGSPAIKNFLGLEFKKDGGVSQITEFGNTVKLFGNESLSFERHDVAKYHSLRRLVGQAMTPESVAKGIPALQAASETAGESILSSDGTAEMEKACTDLTLDVAWRQIIGLDLKDDHEVNEFRQATGSWIKGMVNPLYNIVPLPDFVIERVKPYRAKQFLTGLIKRRIDDLEQNGPDGSTLSSMVFAVDEENQSKKLTRQQIIDNVLLLIVAGSETSAKTLTNAFFLLGSRPEVWNKLVFEQDELMKKHGPALTKDQLDRECPYLDAVVKETMRILPISGGGIRETDETLVIDDVQIRKSWWGMYSIPLTHEQDPITWKEDGSHMDVRHGFRPERWLDESSRPTTEFMPWGAGHRFCLGHTLATAEMKVFLAVMARRMKTFELVGDVDNVKWKEGVITTPKDGVEIAAVSS